MFWSSEVCKGLIYYVDASAIRSKNVCPNDFPAFGLGKCELHIPSKGKQMSKWFFSSRTWKVKFVHFIPFLCPKIRTCGKPALRKLTQYTSHHHWVAPFSGSMSPILQRIGVEGSWRMETTDTVILPRSLEWTEKLSPSVISKWSCEPGFLCWMSQCSRANKRVSTYFPDTGN